MTEERDSRQTMEIRVITVVTGLAGQFISGIAFLGGGVWTFVWGLKHEQHPYVYAGAGAAVFGAMCLPSMFGLISQIYDKFFPNGIPFLPFTKRVQPESKS